MAHVTRSSLPQEGVPAAPWIRAENITGESFPSKTCGNSKEEKRGGRKVRGREKIRKPQVIETPSFWLTDVRARDTIGYGSQWAAASDHFHSGKSIDNLL